MQGIEGGIDNQNQDQKDQRQRHEKRRGRLSLERGAQTGALAQASGTGNAVRLKYDINHYASSSPVSFRRVWIRKYRPGAGVTRPLIALTQQRHFRVRRNGHATGPRAIAAKSFGLSSACSLHTRLPPRPASFPSLHPDDTAGTFSSVWPGYKSVGRPSEAPATQRLTGFDGCTDLGNGTGCPSAVPPQPMSSGW